MTGTAPRRFFPTRSRGQNFLHDRSVAERFAAAVLRAGAPEGGSPPEEAGGPWVVEIGPGRGAITLPLLAAGARVLAVELDPRLSAALAEGARRRGFGDRLRLVTADALDFDFAAALAGFGAPLPVPVCGNLPFSVGSPLLLRLLEAGAAGAPFSSFTLTLQREVAERVAARCGDPEYGALSVVVQQALRPRILFRIHPAAFRPRPRVVASVVRLLPRPDAPAVGDSAHFRSLVRDLFRHRRKTLGNAVLRLPDESLGERVGAAVSRLGLDPGIRPQRLPVEAYAALSRATAPEGGRPPGWC